MTPAFCLFVQRDDESLNFASLKDVPPSNALLAHTVFQPVVGAGAIYGLGVRIKETGEGLYALANLPNQLVRAQLYRLGVDSFRQDYEDVNALFKGVSDLVSNVINNPVDSVKNVILQRHEQINNTLADGKYFEYGKLLGQTAFDVIGLVGGVTGLVKVGASAARFIAGKVRALTAKGTLNLRTVNGTPYTPPHVDSQTTYAVYFKEPELSRFAARGELSVDGGLDITIRTRIDLPDGGELRVNGFSGKDQYDKILEHFGNRVNYVNNKLLQDNIKIVNSYVAKGYSPIEAASFTKDAEFLRNHGFVIKNIADPIGKPGQLESIRVIYTKR